MKNLELKFNRTCLRDFWYLAKPYWQSQEKWQALGLLGLTMLLIILGIKASLGLNEFYKEFVTALQKFNYHDLSIALMHFIGFSFLSMLAAGYAFYCNNLLSLRWRNWLTQHYIDRWLMNHHYHHMNFSKQMIDNPDQRISEDLEHLPSKTLSLFFITFDSSLRIISFGYLLWMLSKNLVFSIKSIVFIIPGYLFFAGFIFGLTGPLLTKWLGKKLPRFDYDLEQYNANFRYSLVKIRESSEQIALSKSEKYENENLQTQFKAIYNNFIKIIQTRKRLELFNSGYNSVGMIYGYLISLPLYMHKKISLGTLMQISGALGYFTDAFYKLISNYHLFAEWRSVVYRLKLFNNSISTSASFNSDFKIIKTYDKKINITNLSLKNEHGLIMCRNINMIILPNHSYLINGTSRSGKSILLRCIAGLWPHAAGTIEIPNKASLFFVPQKQYIPTGTLKDILTYPKNEFIDTITLEKVLAICQLSHLQPYLLNSRNWARLLSASEQQLINFARILLLKPQFVFLDNATSTLDEGTESLMYETLKEFLPETSIISIGYRKNLFKLHKQILTLTDAHTKELYFE